MFQLYRDSQFYWWMKTGVPAEKNRPVASHRQTLSHNVVSISSRHGQVLAHNFSGGKVLIA